MVRNQMERSRLDGLDRLGRLVPLILYKGLSRHNMTYLTCSTSTPLFPIENLNLQSKKYFKRLFFPLSADNSHYRNNARV